MIRADAAEKMYRNISDHCELLRNCNEPKRDLRICNEKLGECTKGVIRLPVCEKDLKDARAKIIVLTKTSKSIFDTLEQCNVNKTNFKNELESEEKKNKI